MKQQSNRTQAIIAALDKCAKELSETKERFVNTQMEYEAAKEKFGGVRRLASEVLSSEEWNEWQNAHRDSRLVGTALGEAIVEVLESKAWSAAWDTAETEAEFSPMMSLNEIVKELDSGGYSFSSATPSREVNAALMKTKGIKKLESGYYQTEEAEEILQHARDYMEAEAITEGEEK